MQGSSQPHASPASGSRASELLAQSLKPAYSRPVGDIGRDIHLAEINSTIQHLLPLPGHAIEQEAKEGQPDPQQGSLGFFFRLSRHSHPHLQSPVYALASRHVAVGPRRPNDQYIRSSAALATYAPDPADIVMVSSKPSRFPLRLTTVFDDIHEELHEAFRKTARNVKNGATDEPMADLLTLHTNAQGYETTLQQVTSNGMADLDPADYVLGPVVFSRGQQTGEFGQWVDWAIVKMQNTSTEPINQVNNKLYLAQRQTVKGMNAARRLKNKPHHGGLEYHRIDQLENLDEDGYLHLHGRDIPKHPPFIPDDNGVRKSKIVGKIGATTCLFLAPPTRSRRSGAFRLFQKARRVSRLSPTNCSFWV